ncbi:MFS general substrate transporter [Glarea lozoyensis ATCC 20868]|uniref:MFS general substrate transporter n=1 Tax=Glarea lozoyensis (strain ATCC 20868 / MF5171) TaxID=1116229 RepID=S3DNZ6_GLAL2|nr:MFS general substrate transporter [Glarea lozoyensis ATCC 20868]EPE33786.1 MFS general substrate transporter [Glarea lozoyensis ATCC 20868]
MADQTEKTVPGATAVEDGQDQETTPSTESKAPPPAAPKTFRFWGTFVALCLLAFISALDVAIITTALPTITAEIGGSKQYIWIANSFVLASSVPQPLFGQLANLFGRRKPIIVSVAFFLIGSGIGGGAINPAMLIAGRSIQGVGAGGIYVLLDIVCCDLVPLRERGKYLGLMFSWSGVAAALGPVLGGALAQSNWRWIFYLNIPICGLALVAILFFMRVKDGASTRDAHQNNLMTKLKKLDVLGNLIFIPSMIAILLGLIMGGVEHPWSSWKIILPLVLGGVGWIVFHIQQAFTENPSVPARLFSNRTSAVAYALTFLSSVLVQAASYFLPVYFQAVKSTTVFTSGVYFLPFAMGTLVFATVAGIVLAKTGSYRPLHASAFTLSAIGFGLFTLLNGSTPKVAWVFYQLINSAGSGLILSVLLPAIMAGLPESDVASSSAAYSFIRTFGYIWGVTIPSLIFTNTFNKNLHLIPSTTLQDMLKDGQAYSFASEAHHLRNSVDPIVWSQVVDVYSKSLKVIWWLGLGISIFGFFLVGIEKGLPLRNTLETDYGIQDEKKTSDAESGEGVVENRPAT